MCPNACPALSSHLCLTRGASSDSEKCFVSPILSFIPKLQGREPPFGPVNFSLSQLRPHHLSYITVKVHLRTLIQRQPEPGKYSYWDTFLAGHIPTRVSTFLPGYIPTNLNGFYSKQHLTGEQPVTLLFWHVSLQIVKLKAKGSKGITEKISF